MTGTIFYKLKESISDDMLKNIAFPLHYRHSLFTKTGAKWKDSHGYAGQDVYVNERGFNVPCWFVEEFNSGDGCDCSCSKSKRKIPLNCTNDVVERLIEKIGKLEGQIKQQSNKIKDQDMTIKAHKTVIEALKNILNEK